MKTIACEQGLAVAMLWLAGQLTIWGIRLGNTAQQRAAARTEQQAQRRAAACKKCPCRPPLGGLPGPADGMAGGPTPALTAKGQGESTPALRAIIYE